MVLTRKEFESKAESRIR